MKKIYMMTMAIIFASSATELMTADKRRFVNVLNLSDSPITIQLDQVAYGLTQPGVSIGVNELVQNLKFKNTLQNIIISYNNQPYLLNKTQAFNQITWYTKQGKNQNDPSTKSLFFFGYQDKMENKAIVISIVNGVLQTGLIDLATAKNHPTMSSVFDGSTKSLEDVVR